MSPLNLRVAQYLKQETAMPIQDYKFFNKDDNYWSIDDTSRRIAQSPGFEAKLRRYYREFSYPINVWVLNKYHKHDLLGAGKSTLQEIKNIDVELYDYIKTNREITKSAVNFIITGDVKAADKSSHPLTPWIVGHRLGHALIPKPAYLLFNKQYEKISVCFLDGDYDWLRTVRSMFTFKSSREHLISDADELTNELFAQWLINGYVKLIFEDRINSKVIVDLEKQKLVEKEFNTFMDKTFTKRIKQSLGKFVID